MKRKSILSLVILALVLPLIALGCAQDPGDTPEPGAGGDKATVIKIGKDPYPNAWPSTYIIKYVAEDLGYKAEFVEGDIGFMFTGVAEGDIDIFPDAWIINLHKPYKDRYGDKIEYAGINYKDAPSGIGAPAYVEIDSLAELQGKGEMFNNRIIGIEPSAGLMLATERAMEAYGLEDEYELVQGSTAGMLAAVEKATNNEDPILFLPWRPHTMFQQFDIKLLKDPKSIFKADDCYIAVNPSFKEKAPDLYKFAQNFKINISDIEKVMYEGDSKEDEMAKLSRQWVDDNQDKIDAWLSQ